MIIYFSGTGNSRYIAKKLSYATGEQAICLNDKLKERDYSTILSKEGLIFVVPTYAWRIPRVVTEWIKKTEFLGSRKAWFVMNCGDGIGNASKYNEELCQLMNFTYMGTAKVIMPENYIAMFDVPDETESDKIIKAANPVIDKLADKIKNKERFEATDTNLSDKIKSGIVNEQFYKLFVKAKAFKVSGKCIGCNKCVALCPLNNIKLTDNQPVWGKNCTHCMACICSCPTGAIEYGNKSVGKRRYLCKE